MITPMLTATSLNVWRLSAVSTSLPSRRPARASQVVTPMFTASVPSMMANDAIVTSVTWSPRRLATAPRATL